MWLVLKCGFNSVRSTDNYVVLFVYKFSKNANMYCVCETAQVTRCMSCFTRVDGMNALYSLLPTETYFSRKGVHL